MFFKKNHEEIIQKILSCSDGNKVKIHHLSSDVSDLVRIIKRLEIVLEQLVNDFKTLQQHVISIEKQLTENSKKINTPLYLKISDKRDKKNHRLT